MPNLIFLTLAACFLAINPVLGKYAESSDLQWKLFKEEFKKEYETKDEEESRMKIFNENVKDIEEHNQRFEQGETSYKKGVNQFSDMTSDEVEQLIYTSESNSESNRIRHLKEMNQNTNDNITAVPDSIDWRELGAVTPVKNQWFCSSGYAFSATGALEGQLYRLTGKLMNFSDQQIVDCSTRYWNNGCLGGSAYLSLAYIRYNGGIALDDFYPYKGKKANCSYHAYMPSVRVTGIKELKNGDEAALKRAVATIGPIMVSLNIDMNFVIYSEGVFYNTECSVHYRDANHFVLIVGYGTTESNGDYWLVKNSWGERWGDSGYMKIARNRNNTCGIASRAVYPVLEDLQ